MTPRSARARLDPARSRTLRSSIQFLPSPLTLSLLIHYYPYAGGPMRRGHFISHVRVYARHQVLRHGKERDSWSELPGAGVCARARATRLLWHMPARLRRWGGLDDACLGRRERGRRAHADRSLLPAMMMRPKCGGDVDFSALRGSGCAFPRDWADQWRRRMDGVEESIYWEVGIEFSIL